MNLEDRLSCYTKTADQANDVCCYCGKSDCDKIALPLFLFHPDREFESDMCHKSCENELTEGEE